MSAKDDLKAKLREKSTKAAADADMLLAEEWKALKKATRIDLEVLRPKILDQAAYDHLIAVIEEATRGNMSLAMLQQRLEKLGANVVQVGKEAAKLLML